MKDEIKEILDILQKCKDYDDEVYLIKQHGATLLLEYITNLQEENEVLKKCLREPRIKSTGVILDKLPVFDIPPQDRIDKAIDKMKDIKYDLDIEPWSIYQVKGNVLFDLLNILQGSDE